MTCGSMAQSDLYGESLVVNQQPSKEKSSIPSGRILVSYGNAVLWELAVEDCPTWFVGNL